MKNQFKLFLLFSFFSLNNLIAQNEGDFRTIADGNWGTVAIWQRYTGGLFVAAPAAPNNADGIINILNSVTINNVTNADEIVVGTTGTLIVSSNLTINNGAGDDLAVKGIVDFQSGTIDGSGTILVENSGVLNITTNSGHFLGAVFTNNGTINWQNDGQIYFQAAISPTNNNIFNITGNGSFLNNSGTGTFINNGTINKSSTGTTTFSMSNFTNAGTMNLNAGIFTNSVNTTNTGGIALSNAIYNSNQTLNLNAGSTLTGTGTFNNNNTLNLNINLNVPSTIVFTNGGTITGAGNLVINSDFTFTGTITGAGSLTVNGNGTWNSGTLDRALTISAANSLNIATNSGHFLGGALTNNGTINWQNDGPIYFQVAITVTNNSIFNITGNSSFLNNSGTGTFINNGTINKSSTGTTTFSMSSFTNAGTMNLNAGIFTNSATTTNTGGIALNTAIYNSNQTLNFNAGSTITGTGTFNNNNTLNLNINLNVPSTIVFTNGGTINGTGNLVINSDFTFTGTITGAGSLTVNGNATWNSGTLDRALTISATNTLNIATNSGHFLGGALTNNGTINWQNDGPIYFQAAITSTNNNIFNITGNGSFVNNSGTGNFINNGTINKSSTGTTTFSMSNFTNAGTMNLNAGIFTNTVSTTNTGEIALSNAIYNSNQTLNFNAGSTLTGTGTFNNNNTLNLNINLNVPSTIVFNNGGTINGAGNLVINSDFTFTGTITGAGSLTVNGNATWNSGTLDRALTISAANTLNIATNSGHFLGGALTNNGTINWQNDGPIYFQAAVTATNNNIFNITGNGSFLNNSGTGSFINNATINKSSTGTTSFSMSSLTNAGTVNLNAGIFTNTANTSNTGAIALSNAIYNSNQIFNFNTGASLTGTGTFNNNNTLNLNINLNVPNTIIFTNGGTIAGVGNLVINSDFTISGTITGAGSLTINSNGTWNSGTLDRALTISAANSLTIATNAGHFLGGALTNNGTINWLNDGPIYFQAAVNLTNNNILNIGGNGSFNNNSGSGTIINNGTVSKTSTGVTSFSIANFSNASSGIIKGLGTYSFNAISNSGKIAPGLSPGILTLNGAAPFSATSNLVIEMFNGSGPGTGNDQLQRAGNLVLDGTLTVLNTGNVPNGTYTIISLSSGTISGSFATTNIPAGYTLVQTSNSVQLVGSGALPINLISFSGRSTLLGNELFWETASETNNAYFEIERSESGKTVFEKIGQVIGANNSTEKLSYSFLDENASEENLYRLKQVDFDGKHAFSKIISVKNESKTEIEVFPNPVSDKINISNKMGKKLDIQLFTQSGALINQNYSSERNQSFQINHIPNGIYILKIKDSGKSISKKIIKE